MKKEAEIKINGMNTSFFFGSLGVCQQSLLNSRRGEKGKNLCLHKGCYNLSV